jgi:hypothetical protein
VFCVEYEQRLKKQLRIDSVRCEIRAEAEEIVEHCVYNTVCHNKMAVFQELKLMLGMIMI